MVKRDDVQNPSTINTIGSFDAMPTAADGSSDGLRSISAAFRSAFLGLFCVVMACPRVSPVDVDRAQREFDLAAALHREQNVPSAVEHLRKAIELDPEHPEAHLLLGLIQYQREDLVEAENHARRSVELLEAQQRQGAILAEARNVLGVILIDRQRYDEAADMLRLSAVDELNRAPHLAWGNLGLAFLQKGTPEAALEPLHESVRQQPAFCVGFHRLGRAYFELERYEEAEAALVASLEAHETCAENPVLQNAWRLRGETRAHLGRRQEALSDFERCVALAANSDDGQVCQRLLDEAVSVEETAAP